jgi:hypothetical protein
MAAVTILNNDRERATRIEVPTEHGYPSLHAVREAMFAFQTHTEATELIATWTDSEGHTERLCRLRFEWLED